MHGGRRPAEHLPVPRRRRQRLPRLPRAARRARDRPGGRLGVASAPDAQLPQPRRRARLRQEGLRAALRVRRRLPGPVGRLRRRALPIRRSARASDGDDASRRPCEGRRGGARPDDDGAGGRGAFRASARGGARAVGDGAAPRRHDACPGIRRAAASRGVRVHRGGRLDVLLVPRGVGGARARERGGQPRGHPGAVRGAHQRHVPPVGRRSAADGDGLGRGVGDPQKPQARPRAGRAAPRGRPSAGAAPGGRGARARARRGALHGARPRARRGARRFRLARAPAAARGRGGRCDREHPQGGAPRARFRGGGSGWPLQRRGPPDGAVRRRIQGQAGRAERKRRQRGAHHDDPRVQGAGVPVGRRRRASDGRRAQGGARPRVARGAHLRRPDAGGGDHAGGLRARQGGRQGSRAGRRRSAHVGRCARGIRSGVLFRRAGRYRGGGGGGRGPAPVLRGGHARQGGGRGVPHGAREEGRPHVQGRRRRHPQRVLQTGGVPARCAPARLRRVAAGVVPVRARFG